jgi:hypothetical protein
MEQKFPWGVPFWFSGESVMQAAIDRVMQTYGMLVNLTFEENRLHGKRFPLSWQPLRPTTKTNWR